VTDRRSSAVSQQPRDVDWVAVADTVAQSTEVDLGGDAGAVAFVTAFEFSRNLITNLIVSEVTDS